MGLVDEAIEPPLADGIGVARHKHDLSAGDPVPQSRRLALLGRGPLALAEEVSDMQQDVPSADPLVHRRDHRLVGGLDAGEWTAELPKGDRVAEVRVGGDIGAPGARPENLPQLHAGIVPCIRTRALASPPGDGRRPLPVPTVGEACSDEEGDRGGLGRSCQRFSVCNRCVPCLFVNRGVGFRRPLPMPRLPVQLISSPKTWSRLIAPARAEILEALRLLGPCSVAEIATALDRPADSLYRHIDLLESVGVVVETGFRKSGRNAERIIDVTAHDFGIDFRDRAGAAENKAIVDTVTSFSKAITRAVRDSAAARQLDFSADSRNISVNYELGWLTPERFAEVRALIRRLKEIMDEGKRSRSGKLYMTLAVATPVTRRRHARGTGAEDAESAPAPGAASPRRTRDESAKKVRKTTTKSAAQPPKPPPAPRARRA